MRLDARRDLIPISEQMYVHVFFACGVSVSNVKKLRTFLTHRSPELSLRQGVDGALAQSLSLRLKPLPSDTHYTRDGGLSVVTEDVRGSKSRVAGCLSHTCFSSLSSRLAKSLIVSHLKCHRKGARNLGSDGGGYGWLAEKTGDLH